MSFTVNKMSKLGEQLNRFYRVDGMIGEMSYVSYERFRGYCTYARCDR